jgi:hypothetical protein
MPFAMDTLGYAKRLRDAGIPTEQAEAHAEAAREFIMLELVTKSDLEAVRRELEGIIDRQTLRLTVRLGAMLGVSIAARATIIKL